MILKIFFPNNLTIEKNVFTLQCKLKNVAVNTIQTQI